MCTVTYIPNDKDCFILTSNRDENAARSPKNISIIQNNGLELIFPRDTTAGGTWIATANTNKVVCLLNGAFEYHPHQPPYKRSRGLMVLDFFSFQTAVAFFEEYDFEQMEPFTMVIYDNGKLYDFRWDERQKHIKELDVNSKYIWASATLYAEKAKLDRQKWFNQFLLEKPNPTVKDILQFHQEAGEGDPWNDIIMNRDGLVQTVSITNIIKQKGGVEMRYHDLLNEELKQAKIDFQSEVVGSH